MIFAVNYNRDKQERCPASNGIRAKENTYTANGQYQSSPRAIGPKAAIERDMTWLWHCELSWKPIVKCYFAISEWSWKGRWNGWPTACSDAADCLGSLPLEQLDQQPLPAIPFDALLQLEHRVSHEGLVSRGGNYSSVSDQTRCVVEVCQPPDSIRILDAGRLVACRPVLEKRRQYRIDPGSTGPRSSICSGRRALARAISPQHSPWRRSKSDAALLSRRRGHHHLAQRGEKDGSFANVSAICAGLAADLRRDQCGRNRPARPAAAPRYRCPDRGAPSYYVRLSSTV